MSLNLESKHFINGIEIRPKDADKISVKMDWTGDAQEAELSVDSLILENKAINSGTGVTVGSPPLI